MAVKNFDTNEERRLFLVKNSWLYCPAFNGYISSDGACTGTLIVVNGGPALLIEKTTLADTGEWDEHWRGGALA